jgi:hypothetical protein
MSHTSNGDSIQARLCLSALAHTLDWLKPLHHNGASSSEQSPLYHIEAGGESAGRSRQIISSRLAIGK